MHTVAKREFLTVFDELILRPRQLDYRVQFPGPGGANAVEAALKLARKVTGRTEVISFTNSFHGMTLGALAVTGNAFHRAGAGIPLSHATPVPFGQSLDSDGQVPDFQWLERLLEDSGSGLDAPAAAIVETVQGEGGINVASAEWLRASPACAVSTASCSSSTTCRWAAAGQARSSASRPRGSPRTSCACRSPSAGTGCRSRSR